MAYEADKVVVELIAENDQFDAAVRQSASSYQQGMKTIETGAAGAEKGHGRLTASVGNSRIAMMEFQHVARGVSDQLAAGASPAQALTTHLGMLSQAVSLAGGSFGKVGAFLGGPWGVALTLATVVGAKLVEHFVTEQDTLEDVYKKLVQHKEQTALNAEAEDMWSRSLDGLIERTKKLTDELQKQTVTQSALNDARLQSAQGQFAEALARQDAAYGRGASPEELKKVDDEVHAAALALQAAQQIAAEAVARGSTDLSQATKDWIDAQRRMMELISHAHPELNDNQAIKQAVDLFEAAANEAAAAKMPFGEFTAQVHQLDLGLLNGSLSADTFAQRVKALTTNLTANTEAFKNQDNAVNRFKQSVIGAEGTGSNRLGSSAAGFGQFMPGTFESYFKRLYPQQAAGMSNSQIDALRNNRAIATAVIDKATDDYVAVLKSAGQQITSASLYTVHLLGAGDARKLLAAPAGENTSTFLSAGVLRGNPFLRGTAGDARAAIARRIGDSSGAVSSGAAAITQAQAQAAKQEADQQAAFTAEMDRLNTDLIKARQEQVKDSLAQIDFQEDEVRSEQQKRDDSYRSAVTLGKLTRAQADQLVAASAQVSAAKIAALETEREAELAKRAHDVADQAYGFAEEALKAQDAAATSQAQHRELQLQILDIVYQQKQADLEYLKMQAERNGQFEQANLIQGQINQLPAQKAADRAQTIRGTMDPLESWLHSIPDSAQRVTEALQGIAVNGFDQIASSIAGVVTGTQSLGQAFRSISQQIVGDIVQMTVRMLIFRAISKAIGVGGGDFDPTIGSLNTGTPALPEFGPASAISIPGISYSAGGNSFVVKGNGGVDRNVLSINGSPFSMVSSGETVDIVPNNASAASHFGGGNSVLIVKVEPNDDRFDAYVAGIAGPLAAQAGTRGAYGGAALARSGLAKRQLHQLGSRG